MKAFKKANKKVTNYFSKHPIFNSFIHIFIGIGAGLMIVPLVPGDLNMWGIGLIVLGILAHLVAFMG